MSLYVQLSDFKGQDKIARDKFTEPELQEYIDKFEVRYLQDLLGCELYSDFAIDFAITGTSPTDPKFIAIWNSFCQDNDCHIVRSAGVVKMLSLFIYFEYLRDTKVKNNIGGIQNNVQANSVEAEFSTSNIYTNYNEALESYWAIQWLICENANGYDWSDYNGQVKHLISMI